MRVLVIDDRKEILILLSKILKKISIEVVTKDNALEALELLKNDQNFDAVLVDLMLPTVDGYTLIDNIKSTEELKNLKLCAISSLNQYKDIKKCFALGVSDYITKPIDIYFVQNKVQLLIDGTKDVSYSTMQANLPITFEQNGIQGKGMIYEINEVGIKFYSNTEILPGEIVNFKSQNFSNFLGYSGDFFARVTMSEKVKANFSITAILSGLTEMHISNIRKNTIKNKHHFIKDTGFEN